MLVGGGCAESSCTIYSTELVDLCYDASLNCSEPVDLDDYSYLGVSLKTPDGWPLFCGGYTDGECQFNNPDINAWYGGPDMIGKRLDSAYVELPNQTYWILSGRDEVDAVTTEYYSDGRFVEGPELPMEGYNENPCAAQLSDDLTFFANDKAFLYSQQTGLLLIVFSG